MKGAYKHHTSLKRIALVFVIVFNALLLTACDDSDWNLFWDFGLDWAMNQGIVYGDTISFTKVGQKVAGDTLDQILRTPEQNALDATDVVTDIVADDQAAEDGAATGDLGMIQSAMKDRPRDWTYTELYGATLLAKGDIAASQQAFENSESLVVDAIHNGADCTRSYRNLFEHRLSALQQQKLLYPENSDIASEITHTQILISQGIPQFCGS